MKKLIVLALSAFVFNITTVCAQELTEKEQKVLAKDKKAAEKAAKQAEKERKKAEKKAAKREAQYAKFKDMVNNYQECNIDTKNIADLDTLIKHMNALMEKVIVLEKEFDAVEMISEPYVDEDGVADTTWYARNKQTKEKYSNEEARTLLNTQKKSVRANNIQAGILVAEAVSAAAAVAAADLNLLEKGLLVASASGLVKQAKLIKYGLTSMNYHLKKNAECLGFQLDNEGDECADDEAELDELSK